MKTRAKLVNRQSTVLLPERDIDKSPVLECVGLGVTFGGLKAVEDFDLTIGRWYPSLSLLASCVHSQQFPARS